MSKNSFLNIHHIESIGPHYAETLRRWRSSFEKNSKKIEDMGYNSTFQRKWKYYLSCHFLAVSSWLIAKDSYKKINAKYRIDFWIGIGTGTWLTAVLMTVTGYLAADLLNKEMLIGLAIVNPIYFFCMMIGAMKNLTISIAVILGTTLGPVIYLFSTEWSLLFAGLIAGSIAFLLGEKNGK